MKSVLIVVFSIIGLFTSAQNAYLGSLRYFYFEDWIGECSAEKLALYLDEVNMEDNEMLKVNKGAAKATTANSELMPWNKLKNFNEEKKYIESVVLNDPENIKIRFIRFTIQSNIPSLLNYYNIEDDKKFILNKLLLQNSDRDQFVLFSRIFDYMSTSDQLSLEEHETIKSMKFKG